MLEKYPRNPTPNCKLFLVLNKPSPVLSKRIDYYIILNQKENKKEENEQLWKLTSFLKTRFKEEAAVDQAFGIHYTIKAVQVLPQFSI